MRLFLLPISTRRTLLYCQRLDGPNTTQQTGLANSITTKATKVWIGWEQKDSGWQKMVVRYGNRALKRIPYEEWGLKSVPPLSKLRREEINGTAILEKIDLSFPRKLMSEGQALDVLRRLGTERKDLHKKRMIYSVLGWPLVAPFAIVPLIPNIPFFYLVYRAWSHWRALYGSKHIEALLDKSLVNARPSKILDTLYSSVPELTFGATTEKEELILQKSTGKLIAKALAIPELEVELDRAIWQIETVIKAQDESEEQKKALDSTNKGPSGSHKRQ